VVQTNGKHAEEEDEDVEDDNAGGESDSPPHLVEVLQNLQSVSITILHQRVPVKSSQVWSRSNCAWT
jgi:hypothetical protein